MPKAKVTKAVIAAAGFGARFLPQTKAMPKEMLPLVDKPIIQYIVEELASSGVEDIVIVTGYHKRAIEDHFDHMSADLRLNLRQGGKLELLKKTKKISSLANFAYVRQKGPYGNGTPLLNAEHLIGDEPFFFTWSDDFIVATPPRFQQMIDVYSRYGCSVLSTIRAGADEDYDRYGYAAGEELEKGIIDIKEIVEKPGRAKAPSDLATVAGYLFTPDIFEYMRREATNLKKPAELYSNNGLKRLLTDGGRAIACEIKNAKFYDAGDKLEYLKTVVDFALERPDVGPALREYLRKKVL